MLLEVKVKVKIDSLQEFANELMAGKLDRSSIISETYCDKENPTVGVSYWKVDSMEEFDNKFEGWKRFYESYEIKEVITAKEAMFTLFSQKKGN